MNKFEYDPGFGIAPLENGLGFVYGPGVFGPEVENRTLDSIRKSLMDPNCDGPEIVYAIAMDVGKEEHKALLEKTHLLYGAVAYAQGQLGDEPVRSQGHIHAISSFSAQSTPEVYEIWSGKAIIYMQEYAEDNPGRCFAVYAGPGDVVIVPPYWAHATVSASGPQDGPMTFGAWCVRDYAFDYKGVRAHNGIAWFPYVKNGDILWKANPAYGHSELVCKKPEDHPELGIVKGEPIYKTFEKNPDIFAYVVDPSLKKDVWTDYIP
ncbi:MAG: glucose-6-phosphate isomerase family protein [Candidatus Cryptobacteroides sp.]